MSTLTDNIDQLLSSKWSQVVSAQVNHAASAGRFCQLLPTMEAVPKDGAEVSPDKLARKAGGETKSWEDFAGILPAKLRSKIEVTAYDGPEGKGFVLILMVNEGQTTLQRCLNHGPETWRSTGWVDVTPAAA